jgi:hypothetical protein
MRITPLELTYESAPLNKEVMNKEASYNKEIQTLPEPFARFNPEKKKLSRKETEKSRQAANYAKMHLRLSKKLPNQHGPFADHFPFNNGLDSSKTNRISLTGKPTGFLKQESPAQRVSYWAGLRIQGDIQPF